MPGTDAASIVSKVGDHRSSTTEGRSCGACTTVLGSKLLLGPRATRGFASAPSQGAEPRLQPSGDPIAGALSLDDGGGCQDTTSIRVKGGCGTLPVTPVVAAAAPHERFIGAATTTALQGEPLAVATGAGFVAAGRNRLPTLQLSLPPLLSRVPAPELQKLELGVASSTHAVTAELDLRVRLPL
mmetsp:Transcript_128380/g.256423  ORF Transcript_128380/g.256423 Transcript_128380/m.256423 type:complete len:184 (+) Transcript_128380:764-1315(+)